MKGQILVFNDEKQLGAVVTADGRRFVFGAADWKDAVPPQRGMAVEFEMAEDNRAQNIYLALPESAMRQDASVQVVPLVQKPKRKSTLTLLTIFLGGLGAHKFYMGAWGWGLVYVLSWFALLLLTEVHAAFVFPLLLVLVFIVVEWIRYILMSDEEFQTKVKTYQAGNPGPFSFFW